MPIYEYKCSSCKSEFECLVLGNGDDISCPDCNGNDVERLMSACSFKSSGTYSAPSAGGGSSCSGCSSTSCSTCH
jgi:putative FmdB family regulatory protein